MAGDNTVKITCECGAEIPISATCSTGRVGICRDGHGDSGWRIHFMNANEERVRTSALTTDEQKRLGDWYAEGGDQPVIF